MNKYKCSKCGCENFFTKKSGNQTGLYCSKCGKWIKWLGKDELRVFENDKKRKYTREEVSEEIYHLRRWCDDSAFLAAVDEVLEMFENME